MLIQTIEDLFMHEISDVYSVEKQLIKALPQFAKLASHAGLSEAFQNHVTETEHQIVRLEQVAQMCHFQIKAQKSVVMEDLIKEGNAVVTHIDEGEIRDMALVSAGQKVEHYEIAAYLHLMQLAKHMGNRKVYKLLYETLSEEEGADDKLHDVCDLQWKKESRYKSAS